MASADDEPIVLHFLGFPPIYVSGPVIEAVEDEAEINHDTVREQTGEDA